MYKSGGFFGNDNHLLLFIWHSTTSTHILALYMRAAEVTHRSRQQTCTTSSQCFKVTFITEILQFLLLCQEWCKSSLMISKSYTELHASWRKGSSRTLWETVEDSGIIYLQTAVLHYTEVAEIYLTKSYMYTLNCWIQAFQWALANSVPKKMAQCSVARPRKWNLS